MDRSFSIQFVSKITGINAHTIRAWEKRYQAVVPKRSDNGKRIYSQDNVDRLKKLHELVKLGNAISDVAKLSDNELESLYGEFISSSKSVASQSTSVVQRIDVNLTLQNLIMALQGYKLDIISHELEKIKNSVDARDFALSVIVPLMSEVGKLVDNGVLKIAQEHSLSAILKFHIGQMLYKNIETNVSDETTIALACPEGELHEFGILIAGLLAGYYNIRFYFLGPNMPAESLAEACNQIDVTHLILGVSASYNHSYSRRLDDYMQSLTSDLNEKVQIIVGGDSGGSVASLFSHKVEFLPSLQMLDQLLSKR